MTSMYDLIVIIVGTPTNDLQADILYITASVLAVIVVFTFIEIVYLLAGLASPKR